jgi:hypothetical protein
VEANKDDIWNAKPGSPYPEGYEDIQAIVEDAHARIKSLEEAIDAAKDESPEPRPRLPGSIGSGKAINIDIWTHQIEEIKVQAVKDVLKSVEKGNPRVDVRVRQRAVREIADPSTSIDPLAERDLEQSQTYLLERMERREVDRLDSEGGNAADLTAKATAPYPDKPDGTGGDKPAIKDDTGQPGKAGQKPPEPKEPETPGNPDDPKSELSRRFFDKLHYNKLQIAKDPYREAPDRSPSQPDIERD